MLASSGTKKSAPAFEFLQEIDKNEVYVGEPILLTYTFKQRVDIKLSEANFNPPSFQDFWAKSTKKVPNSVKDGYKIYRIHYLLFPQKSGTLSLESGRMDVAVMKEEKKGYFSFQQAKWKTLYSNALKIAVKPLPKGVDLYGNYTFSVVVDKNNTKANEPINLTITILGEGNVDDIDPFNLEVKNAMVYSDKPKRNASLVDGKNRIVFKQKFAIVSDQNFTIPALEFRFFDGKVHIEHSKTFAIEVVNLQAKKEDVVFEKNGINHDKTIRTKDASNSTIMIASLLSFVVGMLVMWLIIRWQKRAKHRIETPIQQRIKDAKEDKELLAVLLPLMDKSTQIEEIVKKLEKNIYTGAKEKIDRKHLAKEFDTFLTPQKKEEILL